MNILTVYSQENRYGGLFIDTLSKYSQLYTDTRLNIDDNRVDEYIITKESDKKNILKDLSINKLPENLYLYNIYIPLIYRDDLNDIINYLGINKLDLEVKDIDLLITSKPKKD